MIYKSAEDCGRRSLWNYLLTRMRLGAGQTNISSIPVNRCEVTDGNCREGQFSISYNRDIHIDVILNKGQNYHSGIVNDCCHTSHYNYSPTCLLYWSCNNKIFIRKLWLKFSTLLFGLDIVYFAVNKKC